MNEETFFYALIAVVLALMIRGIYRGIKRMQDDNEKHW